MANDLVGPKAEGCHCHDRSFTYDQAGIRVNDYFGPLSGTKRLRPADGYADLAVEVRLFAGSHSRYKGQGLVEPGAEVSGDEPQPEKIGDSDKVVLVPGGGTALILCVEVVLQSLPVPR